MLKLCNIDMEVAVMSKEINVNENIDKFSREQEAAKWRINVIFTEN